MNIFATSNDPHQAAMWLDDIRANKMTIETAQLLSTSIHVIHPSHNYHIYKMFQPNHPSALWARESRSNFKWLLEHLKALGERNPRHSTLKLIPAFEYFAELGKFRKEELTPFRKVMAKYACFGNANAAYRLYMIDKWREDINPTWKKGERPHWFKPEMEK